MRSDNSPFGPASPDGARGPGLGRIAELARLLARESAALGHGSGESDEPEAGLEVSNPADSAPDRDSTVVSSPDESLVSGLADAVARLTAAVAPLNTLADALGKFADALNRVPGATTALDDLAGQAMTPARARSSQGDESASNSDSSRGAYPGGGLGDSEVDVGSGEESLARPQAESEPGPRPNNADAAGEPGSNSAWSALAEYQRQTETALASAADAAARQVGGAEALAALLEQLAEADARLQAKIEQLASQVANRR